MADFNLRNKNDVITAKFGLLTDYIIDLNEDDMDVVDTFMFYKKESMSREELINLIIKDEGLKIQDSSAKVSQSIRKLKNIGLVEVTKG